MLGEAIAALLVGFVALWMVFQPLLGIQRRRPLPLEPLDPEETPRGVALAALKEIDFDRETGKLSESDYQFLKAKYTAAALQALRAEEAGQTDAIEAMIAAKTRTILSDKAPRCRTCGPRPEQDAVYCSICGLRLSSSSALEPALPANAPAAALVIPRMSDERF